MNGGSRKADRILKCVVRSDGVLLVFDSEGLRTAGLTSILVD
jgi:hypothetical protein